MKPSRHLAATAVLSAATAPWFGWRSLLLLAGGTLVDLDRYAWHAIRYRTMRIDEAMNRFQGRNRPRDDIRVFHSLEFAALLGLACLIWPTLCPLGLGVLFHLALDVMVHKSRGRFRFFLDLSHIQCLTLLWLRGRGEPCAEASERDSGLDP